jgi:hypothetical protein
MVTETHRRIVNFVLYVCVSNMIESHLVVFLRPWGDNKLTSINLIQKYQLISKCIT